MKNLKKLKEMICTANTILLTTHKIPDADGIGSQYALFHALTRMNKKVLCVNDEPLGDRWKFLKFKEQVQTAAQFKKGPYGPQKIDLGIIIDTNTLARVGQDVEACLENCAKTIFIDHHPASDKLINKHCIDPSAAATCELVGRIILSLGLEFSQSMALALYAGILIDTSSFRYPTVTARTHELISKLLATELNPAKAYELIYGAKKPEHLKLIGEVLSHVQTTPDKKIAWLTLDEQMMARHPNVSEEETRYFINHLLVLEEVQIAMFLRYRPDGTLHVALRSSHHHTDVGTIAEQMGGGGHNHSAGFIVHDLKNFHLETLLQELHSYLTTPHK